MPKDLTTFLWLLKPGALLNLYFLVDTWALDVDPHIVVPARILFAVSAHRCLFPNRYNDNVVFHATLLSSTLVTRVLATFSEVAYIYQFSHVIRLLDVERVAWVEALSWLMAATVVVSQLFVWSAILTGRRRLYFYEESGWALIFLANTVASAYLVLTVDSLGNREILLWLNLVFGAGYLPWQGFHLRALRAEARDRDVPVEPVTRELVASRLHRALFEWNRTTDAESWGGVIGLTWMAAYWATLIPAWVYGIVRVVAAS